MIDLGIGESEFDPLAANSRGRVHPYRTINNK
jgi:hypothetical protein